MRVELQNGRHILCGHILPLERLKVGQVWAAGSGTVTIVGIDRDWITYEWEEQGKKVWHQKDCFSFQCRYCLVLDSNKIPEHLK